jgi:hypothetical protein
VLGLAVFGLALSSACAGPPRSAASTEDVSAPYPFSVPELRAGCPLGRVIEYRIEKEGSPPRLEKWAFTPLDFDTVSITTTRYDADGKPSGAPETESAKWTELHEHARFPRSATEISNETLSVPAGTFDVMRYVVHKASPASAGRGEGGGTGGAGDEVKTYFFARTLPGPPIKVEVVRDGHVVMTMTMEANRAH